MLDKRRRIILPFKTHSMISCSYVFNLICDENTSHSFCCSFMMINEVGTHKYLCESVFQHRDVPLHSPATLLFTKNHCLYC